MATPEQHALFNRFASSDRLDGPWVFSVDDHIAMLTKAALRVRPTDRSVDASLGMPFDHIRALPLAYVQALRKTLTPPR